MGLLAFLALVPFAVVMLTSFSKVLVVLSLARSALGTQQAPPTVVLTGLAAVLSAAIMAPVAERMIAAAPSSSIMDGTALLRTTSQVVEPLRRFLEKHGSEEERRRFVELSQELREEGAAQRVELSDWFIVVPAFVITELKEAFQLGFMIFLPFLVVDLVMANVLLALGMQTLSPTQVSLPFKILLFVAVDGWGLLSRGLLLGYR
jgi:type III secretion protein R